MSTGWLLVPTVPKRHGCLDSIIMYHHVAPAIPVDIQGRRYSKTRYKKLVTHVESHANAASLLKSGK